MRGRMVAPAPMVSAVLTPVAQSVVMQRAAWLDDGSVHGGGADGRPRRIKFRSAGDRTDRADCTVQDRLSADAQAAQTRRSV